jgi:hypothetical protein
MERDQFGFRQTLSLALKSAQLGGSERRLEMSDIALYRLLGIDEF